LSFVISIGQGVSDSAVIVTIPLHQTEGRSSYPPCAAISADGRFIAFVSSARLVPTDINDHADLYVFDRESGVISLETVDATLISTDTPAISATGRFLVYEAGPVSGQPTTQLLYFRDRASGVVRALQRGGEAPNGSGRSASISGDGRYVAFASGATNLVDGADANGAAEDVYVADTESMTFRRICPAATGVQPASGSSFGPAISEDGRFVAFSSTAPVEAPAPKARGINTYLHDLQTGVTTRISMSTTGGVPDGSSYSPSISSDGRYVAFVSDAGNLVRRGDRNKVSDIYVRDMVARVTELVSRTPSGAPGNGPSGHPALSGDGHIVVFQSEASDLTCGVRCPQAERDINLVSDIFRHDRRTGVTETISRGRTPWMEASIGPVTDRTGAIVAFASRHPLDQADDRHDYDLFVWARR
jgi:Tol biopolymer transport system component